MHVPPFYSSNIHLPFSGFSFFLPTRKFLFTQRLKVQYPAVLNSDGIQAAAFPAPVRAAESGLQ
jgi:hypothetical protein